MTTDRQLLVADGIRAGYGSIPILHGISLSIAPGETVGVVGHNGMGKTTLLRTLIGELRASAGTIHFDGRDVTRLSMATRARLGLGYVPQGRGIFPDLTVRENLMMGALLGGEERRVEQTLDEFAVLRPLLNRRGGALSGGEQQILALARTLVAAPRLILLDEPSEGIQPSIVDRIVDHLRDVRTRLELAMLVVEQNLEVVAELSDRVFVVKNGATVAELAPARLRDPAVVDDHLGL